MKRKYKMCMLLSLAVLLMVQVNVSALNNVGDTTINIEYGGTGSKDISITDGTLSIVETDYPTSYITTTVDPYPTFTLVRFTSATISYNYTFVNDTKTFVYKLSNSTHYSTIYLNVDYSSITIPENPYDDEIENLTSRIENMTLEINTLNNTINKLKSSNSNLSDQINLSAIELLEKNNRIVDLISEKDILRDARDAAVAEKEALVIERDALKASNVLLKVQLSDKNNTILAKNELINKYDNMKDELTGLFTLWYTDEKGISNVYVNLVWLFIGFFITVIIVYVYISRSSFGGSSKTIASISNRFGSIPFLGRGKKPTTEEWDMIENADKAPDVELKVLKKIEKRQPEEPIEEAKPIQRKQEVSKEVSLKESVGSVPQEDNENYWKSERGQKHFEQLEKLAKGEKI